LGERETEPLINADKTLILRRILTGGSRGSGEGYQSSVISNLLQEEEERRVEILDFGFWLFDWGILQAASWAGLKGEDEMRQDG
jgi:hypothetical protein